MKTYPMDKIRNVALVAPHGVGKTSLADAMLHVTGKVGRRGNVDDGSSVFDYLDEEIERKQTISASLAWTEFDGVKINIIDTPGVDDFRGDMYAALRVVEGVLFVVKADGGFEVAAENLWNHLRETHLSTFIVINRMNKEHADFAGTLAGLSDRISGVAPCQLPIGEKDGFKGVVDLINLKAYEFDGNKAVEVPIPESMNGDVETAREQLIDAAASADDALTEKYLEEMTLSTEDIIAGLKKGTAEGTVYPVFLTAADSEVGVTSLLRAVEHLIPTAYRRARSEMKGTKAGSDDETSFTPAAEGPAVAFAFKRQYEAQGGDVTFLRVFSGSFSSGDTANCSDGRNSERIGQMSVCIGKQKEKVDTVTAGDIVVAAKLKNTHTGMTLASGVDIALPPIQYPVPTSGDAIRPVTSGDEDKMASGLTKIHEEDPTFEVRHHGNLGQTVLVTQGEMHTGFILEKLKRQTGVEVERSRPRIAFKETIRGTTEKQGRHKKQTGGRGQFGDVHLRIEPMPRGEGFEFADEIVGGVVPNKFIPAVEKGCRETLAQGLIAGYEMVDVKCALFFGSYHNVDSSEAAFKSAARIALKKAMDEDAAKVRPVILEPVMKVRIVVPQAYMGDVMGDVSTRRGAIQGSDADGPYQVVTANIPEDELYQYATSLRSFTQGTGTFTMEFSHYAEVPGDVQSRLVEEYKKHKTEDE